MPYNLRKRKAPEPEPEVKLTPKKPAVKKPATKVAANKDDSLHIPTTTPKKPVVKKSVGEKQVDKKPAGKKPAEKKPVDRKPVDKKPRVKKEPPKVEPEESGDESIDNEKTNHVLDTTSAENSLAKKPKLSCNQLVFGADTCGELGFKKIGITKKIPTPASLDQKIKQVACGPMHTLSLTESGLVYSYGCNDEGALGRVTDGDETLEATPTIIKLPNKVTKISTGDSHGLALTDKCEVFVWGNFRDEHGSVGLTPKCGGQASFEPIQLMPEIKFKDIASGSNHALLLDDKGVVYSFGVGAQGQLGRLGPEEIGEPNKDEADKAKIDKAYAITEENRHLFLMPQKVCLKNVDPSRPFVCDAIYAGNFSSFATNTDKKKNRLAGWGLNNYYQLGYKGQKGQNVQYYPKRSTFTCSTSMINVACGQHHTLFLTRTGRVYAAGRNEYGMLGIGKSMKDKKEICPAHKVEDGFDEPISTISAGINTSFAVDAAGKLFAWGMNGPNLGIDSGDDDLIVPTQVKNLADEKVISVSSGSSFTAVIVN